MKYPSLWKRQQIFNKVWFQTCWSIRSFKVKTLVTSHILQIILAIRTWRISREILARKQILSLKRHLLATNIKRISQKKGNSSMMLSVANKICILSQLFGDKILAPQLKGTLWQQNSFFLIKSYSVATKYYLPH